MKKSLRELAEERVNAVEPRDTLVAARKLIEKPENWCKFTQAEDKEENRVDPNDPNACRFDPYGAIAKAGVCKTKPVRAWAIVYLVEALPEKDYPGLEAYNDSHSHADVMALFDKAIEEAS